VTAASCLLDETAYIFSPAAVVQSSLPMKSTQRVKMTPATIRELAAAMKALGAYDGENTEAEHEKEAQRLGAGKDFYRLRLANALLGIVETEAMLSEGASPSTELMLHAHQQSLDSAGAMDSKEKLLGFLRWRTLRIAGPLRQIAQDHETGPIPVAASWAADALQHMLQISADGLHSDPSTISPEAITADLTKAKDSLTYAIANLDIMLTLMTEAEELFAQPDTQQPPPQAHAASYPDRMQRVSKLLLLDVLVPLCVEKRTTHFLIPMVDPAQFQKRGEEWGVWQMPEETFAAFEESKMQEYTRVLTTVSPTFPLTVFAYIDTIMDATMKREKKKEHTGRR
jgi:Family of unknown function (DUF6245)